MPTARRYLVQVDFSKGSEAALSHAVALAKEDQAKIILIHVIPAAMVYPRESMNFDFYALLARDARENMARLAKRHKLKPADYRLVLVRGVDTANVIARQARKLRVSMIIMGSHGRTGLQRLLIPDSAIENRLASLGRPFRSEANRLVLPSRQPWPVHGVAVSR